MAELINFTLFIRKKSRATDEIVSKICIKIPLCSDLDASTVYKIIQRHTNRYETRFKNISV
jgi:hypothetical protein